jgi:DNA primase
VKLLSRFTRRVIVNYDPDTAGQAATERSLTILLEQNCDARVLALPGGKDPDSFIRSEGAAAYGRLLQAAPPYLDYLIGRAQRLGIATAEEKLRAVNFLLPYVQRIPNALLRSEWASRISQHLQVDQPVLREALRRAARERHGQVKPHVALAARPGQPAERRLVKLLMEADELRARLVEEIGREKLHRGLETEKIIAALMEACAEGASPDVAALAQGLDDRDRRMLLEIAFESSPQGAAWEEAESCLEVLYRKRTEEELAAVQRQIEAGSGRGEELRQLLARKQELRQRLA